MRRIIIYISISLLFTGLIFAQTTTFTYQGRLTDGGTLANGQYDLIFRLFDPSGTQIGSDLTKNDVAVTEGIFTVSLDFGSSPFTAGTADSLEIAVRPGASSGAYTTLTPRQPLTSSPYAIKSTTSVSADSLSSNCLLCVTDARIQSIDGAKVTGVVANASSASSAVNVSGIIQIANGGTGSTAKNFVDLSTNQTSIAGNKSFTGAISVTGSGGFSGDGSGLTNLNGANLADGSVTSAKLGADATVAATTNRSLLGSLRWDLLAPKNFAAGNVPEEVAFDGANIWVTSEFSNTVTKLRVSDGTLQGTFSVGPHPNIVTFDGANIWVTNDTNVIKMRAVDGAVQGTFSVNTPAGIAFDGANMWVTNESSNTVTKLRAGDGTVLGTFSVGSTPFGDAFDGANIWVANASGNSITKLRASDGALLGTFTVGSLPTRLAFDGSNIWVTNENSNNVMKLRASDGALQGTFTVSEPQGIAFDGTNIWVTNGFSSTVTKLRASDGVVLGTFSVGSVPVGAAFDGSNIWVANSNSANVTKIPAFQ